MGVYYDSKYSCTHTMTLADGATTCRLAEQARRTAERERLEAAKDGAAASNDYGQAAALQEQISTGAALGWPK